MPEFYTWTILLINQQDEIGEKQLSVFGSRGGQNSPLMHVPLLASGLEVSNLSSLDHFVWPGETSLAMFVEGRMRNICVKLFLSLHFGSIGCIRTFSIHLVWQPFCLNE